MNQAPFSPTPHSGLDDSFAAPPGSGLIRFIAPTSLGPLVQLNAPTSLGPSGKTPTSTTQQDNYRPYSLDPMGLAPVCQTEFYKYRPPLLAFVGAQSLKPGPTVAPCNGRPERCWWTWNPTPGPPMNP